MKDRIHSTNGSRFAMDNRGLVNHPITGRGLPLQSFNLKHTPNIELMRCRLNEVAIREMVVNLHWLGLPRLRAKNYFTHNEVAVINIVLNFTRLNLVNKNVASRDAFQTEELSKLKLFETKVKGPTAKNLKSKEYNLCPTSMLLFAEEFMKTLRVLAGCNQSDFNANISEYTSGMTFGEDVEEELSFSYMRSFCQSLSHNCYFVASLPGCKSAFHSMPELRAQFETEEQLTMSTLEAKVEETTKYIYAFLREKVFVMEGDRALHDGDIQYHLDLGIEFSPLQQDNVSFLLHGEKAKVCLKEFLTRPRTRTRAGMPRPHDMELREEVLIFEVPTFNEADLSLYGTGEVQAPTLARLIEDEPLEGEEGSVYEPGGYLHHQLLLYRVFYLLCLIMSHLPPQLSQTMMTVMMILTQKIWRQKEGRQP